MAPDLRYMKLGRGSGSTWFFVYSIPRELRGFPQFTTRNGKPMTKITESLGTTDREKACEARDQRVIYWKRQFRMLRDGPSEDDIREEAVEVYRATLRQEAERRYTLPTMVGLRARDYTQRLDEAIRLFVAKEIAAYCKRTGALLRPETEPYRQIGIRFLEAKVKAGAWEAYLPQPDGRDIRSDEQHLPPLPKIEPLVTSERPSPLPVPPLTRRETETFLEAFEAYLRTELDGTSAGTIEEYRRKVKIFIDKVGR
jgi:hypothetical protein